MNLILSEEPSIEDHNVPLEPLVVGVRTLLMSYVERCFLHRTYLVVFNHHLKFFVFSNFLGSTL